MRKEVSLFIDSWPIEMKKSRPATQQHQSTRYHRAQNLAIQKRHQVLVWKVNMFHDFFPGPAAYMLPKASVAKPATPAYTMRPKPNVGSFTEDLAKVDKTQYT